MPRRLLLAVPLVLFLLFSRTLLLAMICGAVFAIALTPLCEALRRRFARFGDFAPAVVVLLAMAFVAMPLAICAAFGAKDIETLGQRLVALEQVRLIEGVSSETTKMAHRLGVPLKAPVVLAWMQRAAEAASDRVIELGHASVRGTGDALLSCFVFLLVFYFWLRDHARLQRLAVRLLPLRPVQTLRLWRMLRDSSIDAVLGACLVAMVQATVMLLFLVALGVPGAWLLSIVCFFMAFVPIVGTAPVALFAVAYLLLQQQPVAAAIMIGGAIVVGLSDNALRLMLRPRASTPALISFVAIVSGLELIGIAGLFIGPVVAGLATWAVRELTARRDDAARGKIAASRLIGQRSPARQRASLVARAMQLGTHRRTAQ